MLEMSRTSLAIIHLNQPKSTKKIETLKRTAPNKYPIISANISSSFTLLIPTLYYIDTFSCKRRTVLEHHGKEICQLCQFEYVQCKVFLSLEHHHLFDLWSGNATVYILLPSVPTIGR